MNEATKEVLARLDAIGGKLETTGTALWESAVRYQIALGISELTLSIVGLLLGTCAAFWFWRSWRGCAESKSYEGEQYVVGCIVSALATGAMIVLFASNLYTALPRLLAPEGAALSYLMGR